MTSYSFADGALLALLLAPPALLFVTAQMKARREAALAGPAATGSSSDSDHHEEISQPLVAMQQQVDMMSRAHAELLAPDTAPERVGELEAEVNQAAAWIADLLADRDRRLASENRLQLRLQSMTSELERLRIDRDAILQKSQDLARELAETRQDVVRLSGMLERSEMEKRTLQDELGSLAPRMAELLRLLNELTTERDQLRRDLAVAQGTLSQHHRATIAAETVLEKALGSAPIDEVRAVEADLNHLRSMERERGLRVSALSERIGHIDLEAEAVRERLAVGRPVVERLQGQLVSTRANAIEITRALSNARHRIEGLSSSLTPSTPSRS